MLKIYLGDAKNGASEQLYSELMNASIKEPASKFIAIVPEQSTLQTQRRLTFMHPDHVIMNIDITSFNRLAHKVIMEQGGDERTILNETGKVLILRKVLEECRDDLIVYRGKVHMPGFAAQMKSTLTELAQYDIDDNKMFIMQEGALERGNRLLYSKLQDIRLINRRFSDAVFEKYTIPEEILGTFARLAQKSELIKDAHIYLEGFTGFTPIQYRLIRELLNSAGEVSISLTLPSDHIRHQSQPEDMFYLSNNTYFKLVQAAKESGQKVETINPVSAEPSSSRSQVQCSAYIYRASDIKDEVMFAAGKILENVRRRGKRFRDHAIICSDMESYFHIIRETFERAGIPCFIDYKSKLGDNAMARLVKSAMGLISEKLSQKSVFAYLKCGMTDITDDDLSRLENYCLEFGISGPKAWSVDFIKNRKTTRSVFWDLEQINQTRKTVWESIKDFYFACRGNAKYAREYSDGLLDLMVKNDMETRMKNLAERFTKAGRLSMSKQYEQAYETITRMIEQAGELLGGEKTSPEEYSEMISGAMNEIKVGIIPRSLDAVLIGDLTRTRVDNTDTLFMMGMNDGKMPSSGTSAGLLTERERKILQDENIELAPSALENIYMQHFYIYLMIGKAKEHIYLTYSLSDMQGEEQRPSYILEELDDFGISQTQTRCLDNNAELWKYKASQILADKIRKFAENPGPPESEMQELLRYFALNDENTLRQIMAGTFFHSQTLPLDHQTAIDLYGGRLTGSVSRFEKFFECPFRHFANYGLKIQERPEYEVKAADIGTIYHDSLERYSKKLKEKGMSFRDVSDEDSHVHAKESVEESVNAQESDVYTSTGRNEHMLRRMSKVIEKTTDVLRLHVRQGKYEPAFFEMKFEDEAQDNAVFKGKIDRVDIYDAGDIFVKIIDYKSGNKKFDIKDIYTGQQLQLVTYLDAAIKKVQKDNPGRQVKPGGVYYYLVQDRFVRTEKEAEQKFRMSGLTSCEPEAIDAIDTEAGPGKPSSIVEISYTQTGLSSWSKVASGHELENLISFVNGRLADAGSRIMAGEAVISPAYESPAKNACTFCEYKDICKFEPGKWGCDYNELPESADNSFIESKLYGRYQNEDI